jgi:SAM-dependent methyltransferase
VTTGQQPAPSDYDDNPNRMRLARSVLLRHAAAGDVHELVARRFVAEGLARVLDVGCGEGELARYLPDGAWVGLDNSQTMLERAPAGGVLGAATALPFADESFDGVAPGLLPPLLPKDPEVKAKGNRGLSSMVCSGNKEPTSGLKNR